MGRTGRGSCVAAAAAAAAAAASGIVMEYRRADLAVSENSADVFRSAQAGFSFATSPVHDSFSATNLDAIELIRNEMNLSSGYLA